MDISIKDVNIETFYPRLKEIGFDGIDLRFPAWNQREAILSDEFEGVILRKYQTIKAAGLKVSQVHLTYYPGHGRRKLRGV